MTITSLWSCPSSHSIKSMSHPVPSPPWASAKCPCKTTSRQELAPDRSSSSYRCQVAILIWTSTWDSSPSSKQKEMTIAWLDMRIRECPITSCTMARIIVVRTLRAASKSKCSNKPWLTSPGKPLTRTRPCPCAQCKTTRHTPRWALMIRIVHMGTCKGTLTGGRTIEIRDHEALAIKAQSLTTTTHGPYTPSPTMPPPCPQTKWCRTCPGVLAGRTTRRIMEGNNSRRNSNILQTLNDERLNIFLSKASAENYLKSLEIS